MDRDQNTSGDRNGTDRRTDRLTNEHVMWEAASQDSQHFRAVTLRSGLNNDV